MYSNHNSNIKCVGLIIKCIGFKSIHYAINLNVVSSSIISSNFNSMLLSMYLRDLINKIIFLFKKRIIFRVK